MRKKGIGMLLFLWALFLLGTTAQAKELPYYITVNLTQNIVAVYSKDEAGKYTVPEKAFLCSVGEETPEGTFKTSNKYVWRPLFGNVYGQYATRITGHILFHSVPYVKQDKSTLEYEEYNKLGKTASMGCIRLTVEDVKWIYDNCPSGTTVRMYYSNKQEPLMPKTPAKLDANDARRGWDPTDPDPANPWNTEEIRQMSMQSGQRTVKLDSLYKDGSYGLTAKDTKTLFGHLGIVVILPEADGEQDGTITVRYQKKEYRVPYDAHEGEAYFKLRDLAEMTGVQVEWDQQGQQIQLSYEGKNGLENLFLFRWISFGSGAVKTASLTLE